MNIYKNQCKIIFIIFKNICFVYLLIRNDYKDYQLESRLHFRINAAMQRVKRMDEELNKRDYFK
jgi:hypothetical protein